MIIGYCLCIALVCGLTATRWCTPKHLTTITYPSLLILAGSIQFLVLTTGKPYSGPLLGVVLVSFWALQNRHIPGVKLLLIGLICNGLAMLAHQGAMPLNPEVAQQLGLTQPSQMLLPGSKDVIAQDGVWVWLGDWLVVQLPSAVLVLSPGDLVIVTALGRWVMACRQASQPVSTVNVFRSDLDKSVVHRWEPHPR